MATEKACTDCRLHETCSNILQMGKGKKSARIMIVQENPMESDNIRNEYMTGKGGKMFRAALGEVGIDIDDVYFTAVVKCSSPEDRMPTADEVEACQEYLFSEIDVIKPDIIIPTGNISLKLLAGVTGITKQRGQIIHKDGRKCFPMIHPNMVLKQPKYLDAFSKDMINLAAILEGKTPSGTDSFDSDRLYCETFESAVAEIDRLMNLPAGSDLVVDIEGVKANPFLKKTTMSPAAKALYPESERVKISAIGFSDKPGYGCAIPLYHRETPFMGHEIGTIIKLIRLLLSRPDLNISAHNGKFDMKWLVVQLGILIANFAWDTQLMHYFAITEERGTHDLKQLAWMDTDMGGYDDKMDEYKPKGVDEGNFDLIPWDVLKIYLADDCDCGMRLLVKYKPLILNNPEMKWLWDNIAIPAHHMLIDLETDGLKVDKEWLQMLTDAYPKEIGRLNDKLYQFPEVIAIERELQAKWDERCMLGQIKKSQRTAEEHEKFKTYKKYDPKDGGTTFNFGSHAQLKVLLFDKLGLKTPILTDTGELHVRMGGKPTSAHFSTNDDSLKIMSKQSPIAEILQEFRKANHLNNNFVTGLWAMIDEDGFVHPSYNLHMTVTGRTSSSEPNAQQFPRHVTTTSLSNLCLFQYWHEIKNLFVSRFGDDGVIVQFDYSQLELRILAVFSQDPAIIALYRSGADLHRTLAADFFGVTPEQVTKDQRTASKKLQFGIVYQESAKSLSEDLRGEGIEMSEAECQKFIDRYFARFPLVKKWIDGIKRFAHRNKYVKTMTGRLRRLASIDSTDRSIASEAERQAVNAPIQSTGSDCTLMSLIEINKWLKATGKRSVICITVHDSIGLDCPKDEVMEVSAKVKHIMENLALYNEFYRFLGDVPIVSEMEIGYSYGEAFEGTIKDLEEQGIDGFIQGQLTKKKEKEKKLFSDIGDTKIPEYVTGYWKSA